MLPPRLFVQMNRLLGICFVVLFSFNSVKAQTVFWTETFDGTACAATSSCDPSMIAWTTTGTGSQGSSANKFYVSCQENGNAVGMCGSACAGDQSLHLGNVSTSAAAGFFCPTGDCGASYDASGATEVTNKRVQSPTIDCTGKSTITIGFNYFENGDLTLDDATLWYFNGTVWAQIDPLAKTLFGACAPQGKWTAFSLLLPASANNNASIKIGFRWVNNDDGIGSDPSFAVDDVTLSYLTVLPIELISFKGFNQGSTNKLVWTTASEQNNDFFTIEQSADAIKFFPISIVKGAGNSSHLINYEGIDNSPLSEISYYRLKQTDFNGEYNYSAVIFIDNEKSEFEIVNLYNSIEEGVLEATMNCSGDCNINIELFDITGKKVFSSNIKSLGYDTEIIIPTSTLNQGIYLFKAFNGNKIISKKIKL